MKKFFGLVLAGAALLFAGKANAATVFSDNFDGYADQAAFQAAWTPVGAQPTGTLSTAQSVSAPNSVNISAGSTTAVSQRNERSFTESGGIGPVNQTITWSFDFYDALASTAPFRQYANLQDGAAASTANQLVSMGLNNNLSVTQSGGNYYMARILGYTVPTTGDPDGGPADTVGGAGAYFKLNDFGTSVLRSDGWHNFKVVMSSNNTTQGYDYEFYVDNQLSERVSNIGTGSNLASFELIRIGSGVSSTQQAFFDNMLLETSVPEPASLAALGLGCVALIARRRR